MEPKTALKVVVVLSFAGILFSGYLSYYELFVGGCSKAIISCGSKPFEIANLPACIYGFIMYSVIFVVSILGYRGKK